MSLADLMQPRPNPNNTRPSLMKLIANGSYALVNQALMRP